MFRVKSTSWLVAAKCGSAVPRTGCSTMVRVSFVLGPAEALLVADAGTEGFALAEDAVGTFVWPGPLLLDAGAAPPPHAPRVAANIAAAMTVVEDLILSQSGVFAPFQQDSLLTEA